MPQGLLLPPPASFKPRNTVPLGRIGSCSFLQGGLSVRLSGVSMCVSSDTASSGKSVSLPEKPSFRNYFVKMCGITGAEDAALAAQAGADYVGMIVWPHSKRSVCASLAKEIASAAREFGAEPVGVFVDESARQIERTCDAIGLSFAQLHGDGARASLLHLPLSLPIIYVVHADAQGCVQTDIPFQQSRAIEWILVDSLQGGSGQQFDWENFKVPSLPSARGWLLAGGLHPGNVSMAVSLLRPNGVDVSSGITGANGVAKDVSRMKAFMSAVQRCSSPV